MKILEYFKKNKGFLLTLLLLFAFRWSFADQYQVPSGSMEPNLQIGDRIGVIKTAYDLKIPFINVSMARFSEPQRGDVVVFIWPGDGSTTFVKRLIGIPGDHLQIRNGLITLNGQELLRRNLQKEPQRVTYTETVGEHQFTVQRDAPWAEDHAIDIIVPPDSYFFMGDNRDNSLDSRSWGFVKREALKGKVVGVLWNIQFENWLPKINLARTLTAVP